MKGKLFAKLVSIAIALAMLAPLASVSLADNGAEKPEVKVFIVSFNMDVNIKCVETEDGTPVKKPEKAPEKEGYIFSHWFVKGDLYREPYDFSLLVTGDLNLEPLFLLQAPVVNSAEEENMDDLAQKEPGLENSQGISDVLPPPSDDPPADSDPDDLNLIAPMPDNFDFQDADTIDPVMDAPTDDAGDDSINNDNEENMDEAIDDEKITDINTNDNEAISEISDEDINDNEAISSEEINDNEAISDEDINDDETIENVDEPEEPVLPERSIRIWTDAPEKVEEGHLITLQSELIGYENCVLLLRWQYSTDEGITWQDAEGGTDYTYTYVASMELSKCLWHLCVTVLQEPVL